MQPLSLTLKGFRGIRDGLGRDVLTLDFERLADSAELVAIAGANGRGKTTVMDNMHPYLTMPSRAAMAGPACAAGVETPVTRSSPQPDLAPALSS